MRKLREHLGVAYFQTNPDLALLKLRSMYDGRIRATSLIQCLANQRNRAMFSNLRPDRIEHREDLWRIWGHCGHFQAGVCLKTLRCCGSTALGRRRRGLPLQWSWRLSSGEVPELKFELAARFYAARRQCPQNGHQPIFFCQRILPWKLVLKLLSPLHSIASSIMFPLF